MRGWSMAPGQACAHANQGLLGERNIMLHIFSQPTLPCGTPPLLPMHNLFGPQVIQHEDHLCCIELGVRY